MTFRIVILMISMTYCLQGIAQNEIKRFEGLIKYEQFLNDGVGDTINLYLTDEKVRIDFHEGTLINFFGKFTKRVDKYKTIIWNTSKDSYSTGHLSLDYEGNINEFIDEKLSRIESVEKCFPDSVKWVLGHPCTCSIIKYNPHYNEFGDFYLKTEIWVAKDLNYYLPEDSNITEPFFNNKTNKIVLYLRRYWEAFTSSNESISNSGTVIQAISLDETFHFTPRLFRLD